VSGRTSSTTVTTPPRRGDVQEILHGGANETTLVDVLDRVIDRGVVIQGDILLQVAGIDLVHIGLRVVLRGIGGPRDAMGDLDAGAAAQRLRGQAAALREPAAGDEDEPAGGGPPAERG
jgi:hypothetical protein